MNELDEVRLTEQVLSTIQTGRTASVVYGHMRPVLEELERLTLAALKSTYRAGQFNAVDAQSKIAQLVVLEDLKSRLSAQMTRADQAFTKLNQKGETHGN